MMPHTSRETGVLKCIETHGLKHCWVILYYLVGLVISVNEQAVLTARG